MKLGKRRWSWIILTVPRRCVVCGGEIPGGTKAMKANFRGEITLCGRCREALDKDKRLTHSQWPDEPELLEGFDINE